MRQALVLACALAAAQAVGEDSTIKSSITSVCVLSNSTSYVPLQFSRTASYSSYSAQVTVQLTVSNADIYPDAVVGFDKPTLQWSSGDASDKDVILELKYPALSSYPSAPFIDLLVSLTSPDGSALADPAGGITVRIGRAFDGVNCVKPRNGDNMLSFVPDTMLWVQDFTPVLPLHFRRSSYAVGNPGETPYTNTADVYMSVVADGVVAEDGSAIAPLGSRVSIPQGVSGNLAAPAALSYDPFSRVMPADMPANGTLRMTGKMRPYRDYVGVLASSGNFAVYALTSSADLSQAPVPAFINPATRAPSVFAITNSQNTSACAAYVVKRSAPGASASGVPLALQQATARLSVPITRTSGGSGAYSAGVGVKLGFQPLPDSSGSEPVLAAGAQTFRFTNGSMPLYWAASDSSVRTVYFYYNPDPWDYAVLSDTKARSVCGLLYLTEPVGVSQTVTSTNIAGLAAGKSTLKVCIAYDDAEVERLNAQNDATGAACGLPVPSPSASATPSVSPSPSATASNTGTPSPTRTATATGTTSAAGVPVTPSPTPSRAPASSTPSTTATSSRTPSGTPSSTPSSVSRLPSQQELQADASAVASTANTLFAALQGFRVAPGNRTKSAVLVAPAADVAAAINNVFPWAGSASATAFQSAVERWLGAAAGAASLPPGADKSSPSVLPALYTDAAAALHLLPDVWAWNASSGVATRGMLRSGLGGGAGCVALPPSLLPSEAQWTASGSKLTVTACVAATSLAATGYPIAGTAGAYSAAAPHVVSAAVNRNASSTRIAAAAIFGPGTLLPGFLYAIQPAATLTIHVSDAASGRSASVDVSATAVPLFVVVHSPPVWRSGGAALSVSPSSGTALSTTFAVATAAGSWDTTQPAVDAVTSVASGALVELLRLSPVSSGIAAAGFTFPTLSSLAVNTPAAAAALVSAASACSQAATPVPAYWAAVADAVSAATGISSAAACAALQDRGADLLRRTAAAVQTAPLPASPARFNFRVLSGGEDSVPSCSASSDPLCAASAASSALLPVSWAGSPLAPAGSADSVNALLPSSKEPSNVTAVYLYVEDSDGGVSPAFTSAAVTAAVDADPTSAAATARALLASITPASVAANPFGAALLVSDVSGLLRSTSYDGLSPDAAGAAKADAAAVRANFVSILTSVVDALPGALGPPAPGQPTVDDGTAGLVAGTLRDLLGRPDETSTSGAATALTTAISLANLLTPTGDVAAGLPAPMLTLSVGSNLLGVAASAFAAEPSSNGTSSGTSTHRDGTNELTAVLATALLRGMEPGSAPRTVVAEAPADSLRLDEYGCAPSLAFTAARVEGGSAGAATVQAAAAPCAALDGAQPASAPELSFQPSALTGSSSGDAVDVHVLTHAVPPVTVNATWSTLGSGSSGSGSRRRRILAGSAAGDTVDLFPERGLDSSVVSINVQQRSGESISVTAAAAPILIKMPLRPSAASTETALAANPVRTYSLMCPEANATLTLGDAVAVQYAVPAGSALTDAVATITGVQQETVLSPVYGYAGPGSAQQLPNLGKPKPVRAVNRTEVIVRYVNVTQATWKLEVDCGALTGRQEVTCGGIVAGTPINYSCPITRLQPTCAFYNDSTGTWSDNGCTVAAVGDDYVLCACTHLTEFAARFSALAQQQQDMFAMVDLLSDPRVFEQYPHVFILIGSILGTLLLLTSVVQLLDVRGGRRYYRLLMGDEEVQSLKLIEEAKGQRFVLDRRLDAKLKKEWDNARSASSIKAVLGSVSEDKAETGTAATAATAGATGDKPKRGFRMISSLGGDIQWQGDHAAAAAAAPPAAVLASATGQPKRKPGSAGQLQQPGAIAGKMDDIKLTGEDDTRAGGEGGNVYAKAIYLRVVGAFDKYSVSLSKLRNTAPAAPGGGYGEEVHKGKEPVLQKAEQIDSATWSIVRLWRLKGFILKTWLLRIGVDHEYISVFTRHDAKVSRTQRLCTIAVNLLSNMFTTAFFYAFRDDDGLTDMPEMTIEEMFVVAALAAVMQMPITWATDNLMEMSSESEFRYRYPFLHAELERRQLAQERQSKMSKRALEAEIETYRQHVQALASDPSVAALVPAALMAVPQSLKRPGSEATMAQLPAPAPSPAPTQSLEHATLSPAAQAELDLHAAHLNASVAEGMLSPAAAKTSLTMVRLSLLQAEAAHAHAHAHATAATTVATAAAANAAAATSNSSGENGSAPRVFKDDLEEELDEKERAAFGWVDPPPSCIRNCGILLWCCRRHPVHKARYISKKRAEAVARAEELRAKRAQREASRQARRMHKVATLAAQHANGNGGALASNEALPTHEGGAGSVSVSASNHASAALAAQLAAYSAVPNAAPRRRQRDIRQMPVGAPLPHNPYAARPQTTALPPPIMPMPHMLPAAMPPAVPGLPHTSSAATLHSVGSTGTMITAASAASLGLGMAGAGVGDAHAGNSNSNNQAAIAASLAESDDEEAEELDDELDEEEEDEGEMQALIEELITAGDIGEQIMAILHVIYFFGKLLGMLLWALIPCKPQESDEEQAAREAEERAAARARRHAAKERMEERMRELSDPLTYSSASVWCGCITGKSLFAYSVVGAWIGFCLWYMLLFGLYQPEEVTMSFVLGWLVSQAYAAFFIQPVLILAGLIWAFAILPAWLPYLAWIPCLGGLIVSKEARALSKNDGSATLSGRMQHLTLVRAAGYASAMRPETALIAYGATAAVAAAYSGMAALIRNASGRGAEERRKRAADELTAEQRYDLIVRHYLLQQLLEVARLRKERAAARAAPTGVGSGGVAANKAYPTPAAQQLQQQLQQQQQQQQQQQDGSVSSPSRRAMGVMPTTAAATLMAVAAEHVAASPGASNNNNSGSGSGSGSGSVPGSTQD